MKKTHGKLLSLLTALALSMIMTVPAPAAPKTEYIDIRQPFDKSTWYVGEKIPYYVPCERPGWMDGSIYLSLKNSKTKKEVWSYSDMNCFTDPDIHVMLFDGKINTKKLATGTYTFAVNMKVDNTNAWLYSGDPAGEPYQSVNETASVTISLKKLKAPTKLKAKAGDKKVTLSWKKAKGAEKYAIYRSTRKDSGYKKIASTTKTKFVDKKLKSGKRYYYKVRTLRGSAKSGFTKPVLSGNVK